MAAPGVIRIGTRGSALALWQARHVAGLLTQNTGIPCELVTIKTRGDKILDVALAKVGGKGLFVKEIEQALIDGRVDVAVHPMKDMPGELMPGLAIGAVPPREDPSDVLVCREASGLADLPRGARVGTSSLRRKAQLLALRPDLCVEEIRGNVETRINKLSTENLDAVVLAAAGMRRMGLWDKATEVLDPEVMLPAAAQGALAIEIRENDPDIASLVRTLEDPAARALVTAERSFLLRMEGSCQIPVAAMARRENGRLALTGMVADLSGEPLLKDSAAAPVDQALELGADLADKLLARGGREILDKILREAGEQG
ncbi:MAG: hydroxymethylbilane synthase [Deltaproteobacteria bacterium]|nr:hydroxymethylbilane synthase [Deltaproteobacteria bacterium]